METQNRDNWNPDYMATSPLFFPLRDITALLNHASAHWPTLEDYQNLLARLPNPPKSQGGNPIRFVHQATKTEHWTENYEPRIFLTGEVQTRQQNWHDFFQVLIWAAFPQTKAILNAKHYDAIAQRLTSTPGNKQRSVLENALTQFDECGAILVSSDTLLWQCIREFRWKSLFWRHRALVQSQLRCFVFGHAIYEKALNPYLGMTAHAILLTVAQEFFDWPLQEQLDYVDSVTAASFRDNIYDSPKSFQPFPLLGMPGWDKNNNVESYYDNVNYFRSGRSKG